MKPISIIPHVEGSGTLPAPVRNTPEADVKVKPGGGSIVIGSVTKTDLSPTELAPRPNVTTIVVPSDILTAESMAYDELREACAPLIETVVPLYF